MQHLTCNILTILSITSGNNNNPVSMYLQFVTWDIVYQSIHLHINNILLPSNEINKNSNAPGIKIKINKTNNKNSNKSKHQEIKPES